MPISDIKEDKPREVLANLIKEGQEEEALEMIAEVENYHEGEEFVFAVLREDASSEKIVEAVLQAFLDTRSNYYRSHGYWVHSLSHFTKYLWERRMDDWVKKFNEVSFRGANELQDSNCSDRLVDDFVSYANWDDDPADFHLTFDNLEWMEWSEDYYAYTRARIASAPFETEEAFLRWWLRRPEEKTTFDFDAQQNLVDVSEIKAKIERLQALNEDVSEFDGLIQGLLTKQLQEAEAKLADAKADYERERAEAAVKKTREQLAQ